MPVNNPAQPILPDQRNPNIPAPQVSSHSEIVRAAGFGALASRDPERDFLKITSELTNGVDSETLNEIMRVEQEAINQEVETIIGEVLLNDELSNLEKQDLILRTQRKAKTLDIRERALNRLASNATVRTAYGAYEQVNIAKNLEQIKDSHLRVQEFAHVNVTFDDNTLADTIAGLTVPFTYGKQIVDAIGAVDPELVEASDYLLVGDLVRRWGRKLNSLPIPEREERLRSLIRHIENTDVFGVEDNGFVKYDLIQTLIERPFTDSIWDEVIDDFASILDIGVIAEAARIPFLFKNLRNSSRATRGNLQDEVERASNVREETSGVSVVDAASDVAPEDAATLLRAAVDDETGDTARALGITRIQAISESFFKTPGNEFKTLADTSDPRLASANLDFRHSAFSFEELEEIQGEMDLILRARLASTEGLHMNKMGDTQAIPGGYETNFRIGPDNRTHFTNLNDAMGVVKLYDGEYETASILARNYRDGGYIRLDDVAPEDRVSIIGPTGTRQYLVDLKARHYLNPFDARVEGGINPGGSTGAFAKWIDKSNSLMKWLRRAGNVMGAQANQRRFNLNQTLQPVNDMDNNLRGRLFQAIDAGDRAQKRLTDEQLLDLWQDLPTRKVKKLFEGMRAFQRFQRQSWTLLNDNARQAMVGDNLKRLRFNLPINKAGDKETVGKVVDVDDIPSDVKAIYNAATGKTEDITPEFIKMVVDSGGQFVQFRRKMMIGGRADVRYGFIQSNKVGRVEDLPEHVIPWNDWYVPRIYDVTHIVKKKIPMRDDTGELKDRLVTLNMYSDVDTALEDARKMAAKDGFDPLDEEGFKNSGYVVVKAQEVRDLDFANRTSLDALESIGMTFYSRRGVEKAGLDGKRALMPVGDAIEALRDRAARAGTLDLLVQKLTRNWNQRYGEYFQLDETGNMPLRGDLLRTDQDILTNREIKDANAFRDHIRLIAGIDETAIRRGFTRTMDWVSEKFAQPTFMHSKTMSEMALRSRDANPLALPKMINFGRFMVLQPVRQAFMQAQQATIYTGVDHGFKYWFAGSGVRDMSAVVMNRIFRDIPGVDIEAFNRRVGKSLGMSESEYNRLVEAFDQSGIFANIDSHQYAAELADAVRTRVSAGGRLSDDEIDDIINKGVAPRASIPSRLVGKTRDMTDFTKNMLRFSRIVGFDLGEKAHRLPAFLTARQRFIKNNPDEIWDAPDNLGKIIGDAEELALNMNREGTLEFQRNWLGLAAQFTSHATKTLQLLIPDTKILGLNKVANRAFSNREKAKIAAIQAALYGSGGFGLNELVIEPLAAEYEQLTGADLSPEIIRTIEEGIAGTLFNIAWKEAAGQLNLETRTDVIDTDIEFSSNIAPFSAIIGGGHVATLNNPVGKMLDAFIFQDADILATLFGPTAQLGRDMANAARFTYYAMGGSDVVMPQDANEAALILQEWATKIAPIYGNYVRGETEFHLNRLISGQTQEEGVQATDAEILARTLLGIQPRRSRQIGNLERQITGVHRSALNEPNDADLSHTARTMYQFFKTTLRRTQDGHMTQDELMDLVRLNAQAMRVILPLHEYHALFNVRMRNLIDADRLGDGQESEFIKAVVAEFGQGDEDPFSAMVERIENMTPFEGQDLLVQRLKSLRD